MVIAPFLLTITISFKKYSDSIEIRKSSDRPFCTLTFFKFGCVCSREAEVEVKFSRSKVKGSTYKKALVSSWSSGNYLIHQNF